MRGLLLKAIVSAGIGLGLSFPASAVTFVGSVDPSSTANTGPVCDIQSASPGTGVCFSDMASLNFDLEAVGDSAVVNLFKVQITEEPDSRDDKRSVPVKVLVTFTQPGDAEGLVLGEITGSYSRRGTTDPSVSLVWDPDPIEVDFGGIVLQIALMDLVIDCDDGKCTQDRTRFIRCDWSWGTSLDYGYVQAKFILKEVPAQTSQIPLPATLPLFASCFAGLAYFGRKRR